MYPKTRPVTVVIPSSVRCPTLGHRNLSAPDLSGMPTKIGVFWNIATSLFAHNEQRYSLSQVWLVQYIERMCG